MMKKSRKRVEIFYEESLTNAILISYLRDKFPTRRENKYKINDFENIFIEWTNRFVTQKTTKRKRIDGVLPHEIFVVTGNYNIPKRIIKSIIRLKTVYPNMVIHIVSKKSIPYELIGLVVDHTSIENGEKYAKSILLYLEVDYLTIHLDNLNVVSNLEERDRFIGTGSGMWDITLLYEIIGFEEFVNRFRLNPSLSYTNMSKTEKRMVDIKRSSIIEERNKLVQNMKKFTHSLGDGEWYIIGEIYTHQSLSQDELSAIINKVEDVDVLVIIDLSKEEMTIAHLPWVTISFFNMILNVHFGLSKEIDAYESRVTVSYKPIYHGMNCIDRMKEISYS